MGVDVVEDQSLDPDKIKESEAADNNLLLKVEELIEMAMGEPESTTVNFKILQAILFILSRQLKLLNQRVEIVNSTPFERLTQEELNIDQENIFEKEKAPITQRGKEIKDHIDEYVEEVGKPIQSTPEFPNLHTDKVLLKDSGSDPQLLENSRKNMKARERIEVVTLEQFETLKELVEKLQKMAAPIPLPSMPDNDKLKSDIVKGTASLTDTMQALNISSRVQAAEAAIDRLVDLITHLAATGTIPRDFADKALLIKAEGQWDTVGEGNDKDFGLAVEEFVQIPQVKDYIRQDHVTTEQMEYAIRNVTDELMQNLHNCEMTTNIKAKNALKTAKTTALEMESHLTLSGRIHALQSLVDDHTQILRSFRDNRDTQIQAIKEQMTQLMVEVNYGMEQIEVFQNDSQDVAIQELKIMISDIQATYDEVVHKERQLFDCQDLLFLELKRLQDAVQFIRLEKADRDEVQDGLKDKADLSCLSEMITEKQYDNAVAEVLDKLAMCHDKFDKQNAVWKQVLDDFTQQTLGRVKNEEVRYMRNDIQADLQKILEKIQELERVLAEPKALLLARKLEKDTLCGICREPTHVDPRNVTPLASLCKVQLPAMNLKAVPENELKCARSYRKEHGRYSITKVPPCRTHACHRWTGGSHTVISKSAPNYERVEHLTSASPMQNYYGIGSDGKSYRMQQKLAPCKCNLNAGGDATTESLGKISVDQLIEKSHECQYDSEENLGGNHKCTCGESYND